MSVPSSLPILDALHDIAGYLAERKSLRTTLTDILRTLEQRLGLLRAHIVVENPESHNLRLSLCCGQACAHVAYMPGRGVTGRVFSGGKSIIVPLMKDHPDFRNRLFLRSEEELASLGFICVPVQARGRTLGTLSADTPAGNKDDASKQKTLCDFLECVALMIGSHVAWIQEDMDAGAEERSGGEELPVGMDDFVVGQAPAMRAALRQALLAAPSRATVLILGESGSGKELMAEAIHKTSPRRARPFVTLNCAALPSELLEGELFGWRRGAFTNAVQNHRGLFEQADGGTLFLDEIGDLSLQAQAKVLRAIQERRIQSLGSERSVSVDVRLICATNRPLEQLVRDGRFREDLYYRINVFPINMPPLRRRKEDIPLLAGHFLRRFQREYGTSPGGTGQVPELSSPALETLLAWSWPGNVRELQNVMERAFLLCEDGVIRTRDLPDLIRCSTRHEEEVHDDGASESLLESVSRLETRLIDEALKASGGNIHEAARKLHITYRMLYYKMKKYGMDYRRYAAPEQVA